MKTAIVWFNGPSRDSYLNIEKKYTEFGCNHIRRHRAVDHVCVYDPITIPYVNVEPNVKYWTRNGHSEFEHFKQVWYAIINQPQNSGVMAVRCALNLGYKKIYIIGCDWGITNKSVYQYKRQSELKYSNSQCRLLERWDKEPGVEIIVVRNDNKQRDLRLLHTEHIQ